MISISGEPYDSLQEMIGISGDSNQSLKAYGVNYEQIDLIDNEFDEESIVERCYFSTDRKLFITNN